MTKREQLDEFLAKNVGNMLAYELGVIANLAIEVAKEEIRAEMAPQEIARPYRGWFQKKYGEAR